MNVCGSVMPFVSSGAMTIAASTNCFVAAPVPFGPLLAPAAVERVRVAELGVPVPVNVSVVLAFSVNVAAVGLLTVTVQV